MRAIYVAVYYSPSVAPNNSCPCQFKRNSASPKFLPKSHLIIISAQSPEALYINEIQVQMRILRYSFFSIAPWIQFLLSIDL